MRKLLSATALVLVTTSTGCVFRPHRPAPVDLAAVWTTSTGHPAHAAFADQRINPEAPEEIWNVGAGRGLNATPVAAGSLILAATTNRIIMALSQETGERYWEHRKRGPLSVPPVVDGDMLFVATSDVKARIYGLRVRDGRKVWEKKYPAVAVPMLIHEGQLVLATEGGTIYALATDDGRELWATRLRGQPTAAPVIVGDRILVATAQDSLFALSADQGEVVARIGLGGQASAVPAVEGERIYVPLQNGEMVALAGLDLDEEWRVQTDGPILAPPAVDSERNVYLLDRTGVVWTVSPMGQNRRLAELGSTATGSLTLTQNALLVGLLDGRLIALDRHSGETLWTRVMGDSMVSPMIVKDGFIFVPLRRGRVVKLR